jgi:F0F1-type ATP synthase alpha subunit
LDVLELSQIKGFERYLLDTMRKEKNSFLKEIREKKIISAELEQEMLAYMQQTVATFKASQTEAEKTA